MPDNLNLLQKYNTNAVFIDTDAFIGENLRTAHFAGYKTVIGVADNEEHLNFCKSYFQHIDSIIIVSSLAESFNICDSYTATVLIDGRKSIEELLICIKQNPAKAHTIIIDNVPKISIEEIKSNISAINSQYILSIIEGRLETMLIVADTIPYKSFNIVVFSKNRAMQLDLFIRSFNRFVKDAGQYLINVLYTYSTDKFRQGYDKLLDKNYLNVKFKRETNFKADLVSLLKSELQYIVFFVDDNIFKNPLDFFDSQMDVFNSNSSIICRSLRLHRNLNYCYPARVQMTPPPFDDNGVFRWYGQLADYGYPFSVDGHIFKTSIMLLAFSNLQYTNPNTLEGIMQKEYTNCEYMICYEKSIIVNNPLNRVQTVNNNIHGNISAEWLNDQFLLNKQIRLEPFVDIENTSCHQELPIELEDAGHGN